MSCIDYCNMKPMQRYKTITKFQIISLKAITKFLLFHGIPITKRIIEGGGAMIVWTSIIMLVVVAFLD